MLTAESLSNLYTNGNHTNVDGSLNTKFEQYIDLHFNLYSKVATACFVTGQPYNSHIDLFEDISKGYLKVSTDYNNSPWLSEEYNLKFRYVHDMQHYLSGSDFSLEGEIKTFLYAAKDVSRFSLLQILFSEIVLQAATAIHTGQFPQQRLVLVEYGTIINLMNNYQV